MTSAKRSRAISSTTEIARATQRQTRNRGQVADDDELPPDALALLRRTGARGKEVGKAGEGDDGEGDDGEDAEAKGSDEEVPTPLA